MLAISFLLKGGLFRYGRTARDGCSMNSNATARAANSFETSFLTSRRRAPRRRSTRTGLTGVAVWFGLRIYFREPNRNTRHPPRSKLNRSLQSESLVSNIVNEKQRRGVRLFLKCSGLFWTIIWLGIATNNNISEERLNLDWIFICEDYWCFPFSNAIDTNAFYPSRHSMNDEDKTTCVDLCH